MDKQLTVIVADTNVWKDNLCDKQERPMHKWIFWLFSCSTALCKKFPRYCCERIKYADTVMKYFVTIFLIKFFYIL